MNPDIAKPIQPIVALVLCALFVTGCSSSSDSTSTGNDIGVDNIVVDGTVSESVATPADGNSNIVDQASESTNIPATPDAPTTPDTPTTSLPDTGNIDALLTSIGTGSPLSVANSRNFLPVLFALANADPVQLVFNRFINTYEEVFDIQNGSANGRFSAQSTSDISSTFTCPDGGSYTISTDVVIDGPGTIRHAFNQCRFDGISFDGETVTLNVQFSDTGPTDFTTRDPFNARPFTYIDQQGVTYVLDGFYDDTLANRLTWGGQLEIQDGNRTLSLDHAFDVESASRNSFNPELNVSVPSNVYTSTFTVNGTVTNGRTLEVNTQTGFQRFGDTENFSTGLLVVQDTNGGQLSLTAEPGLSTGFTVRVDTEGEVDQYVEDWSTTLDFLKRPLNSQ